MHVRTSLLRAASLLIHAASRLISRTIYNLVVPLPFERASERVRPSYVEAFVYVRSYLWRIFRASRLNNEARVIRYVTKRQKLNADFKTV